VVEIFCRFDSQAEVLSAAWQSFLLVTSVLCLSRKK
jgi:hypothetical protein